jgi:hypothetical protein
MNNLQKPTEKEIITKLSEHLTFHNKACLFGREAFGI